jgi:ribose-phosphate pyrophosphokinase
MLNDELVIFAGTGSKQLTRNICDYLDIPVGKGEVLKFSEGNLFVRVLENVRGRDVFIVQSTSYPANDNFMELLFWIDALKRASAQSVTAVIPYFSYAKGDKKDEPRVSIRARVCADAIQSAGADRVVTLDLHAPQIQGFFKIPVDDLYALPILCNAIREKNFVNPIIVSPDAGFAKKARLFASALKWPLAIADKERSDHDEKAEILHVIGDVAGKSAVVVDDFTISGNTLCNVARKLIELGAVSVNVAISHGVFAEGALKNIETSPIECVMVTDSVENLPEALTPKIQIVSVANLFGEAIKRIFYKESISSLFKDKE